MWTLPSVPLPIYSSFQVNLTFLHFAPQEALQRELVLKQKMVILQDLLSTLIRASDSSWKVREWNLCLNRAYGLLWVAISFFFPYHPSKRRRFLTIEDANMLHTWESSAKSRVICWGDAAPHPGKTQNQNGKEFPFLNMLEEEEGNPNSCYYGLW